MGRMIVHHDGQFLEWSTVVDAPVTFGMTAKEMGDHLAHRYGEEGAQVAPDRIARAIANGTSARPPLSFEELIAGNRAGPKETELSEEQLVRIYFVEKRDPDPSKPEDMGVDPFADAR